MTMARVASYEYKNDFFYIIVRQAPEHGAGAYLLCCGVNITRFDAFCRGSHGICSNPAFRGLQLLQADLAAFAISQGVRVNRSDYGACMLIAPKGDGWYRESLLLSGASPKIAKAVLNYAVHDLLTKVLTVAAPRVVVPKKLPNPPALQAFIESLENRTLR